jgi:RNA polymerase sigma factor (sigma-70 family)
MAKPLLNGVIHHLRNIAAVQTYQGLPDHELLERYVKANDETAFTVLIERHGPMVFGVCRRTLPNFHDAEDACQACFLVLARKAASVRKKASLSSWLHGVAYRLALKLKRDSARRKARELGVNLPASKDPAAEVSWREAQGIMDEMLQRLPARYREPLILCYLECLTRDEAAQRLGLSSGSLHGRLERARDLLRKSLAQRGLTLPVVMFAAMLGESASQGALAPLFVVSLTKAAKLLAGGHLLTESVVSTKVIALTQEVLKNMFLTNLKIGTAAVLCAGLFAALLGGSFTSPGIAQEAKPNRPIQEPSKTTFGSEKAESDTDFIRRISNDLRGNDPTPAEIHFFIANKDDGKRQKLIDLFIQERQERQAKAKRLDRESESLAIRLALIGTESKRIHLGDVRPTFPSAEEVLLALPEKARTKNLRHDCQLIEYKLNEPKIYPLVGRARLEHAHFKCTAVTDDGIEVVYIDRDHLIPLK